MSSTPATGAPHAPSRPAFLSLAAWARLLVVATIGLVIDLWSKHVAFEQLGHGEAYPVIDHVLELQIMLNPGALFGIGGGMTTVFLVASAGALALVVWMFVNSPSHRWALHLALGAILAGAVGNMHDRIFVRLFPNTSVGRYMTIVSEPDADVIVAQAYPLREGDRKYVLKERPETAGYVRDFIKIPTKLFGDQDLWPWVFNVADMLLICGVGTLAIHLWRDGDAPEKIVADAGNETDGAPNQSVDAPDASA